AGRDARGLRGLPRRGVRRPRGRRGRPGEEGRRADARPVGRQPSRAGGRHAGRLARAVRAGRGARRPGVRPLHRRGAAGGRRRRGPALRRLPAVRLSRRQFEALVDRALARLPRRFREKLDNVAVVVEDWADEETLAEMGIEPPDTLYGLYRGTDLTRRDSSYGGVLPDVITIYQGPIE